MKKVKKIITDFKYCILLMLFSGIIFYFKTTITAAVFFGIAIGCTLLYTIVYIAGRKALEEAAANIDKKISIQKSMFEKN